MARDVLNIQASSTASKALFLAVQISNRRPQTLIGQRQLGNCNIIQRLDTSGAEKLEGSNNNDTDQADPDKAKDNNHSVNISRFARVNMKIMGDQSSNSAISRKNPPEPASPPSKKRKLSAKPRRRTGKKDRHSKICTAQGVRDRRMRLSLQIARKFFDLQDMLGFDKESKTIEWLFSKSKNAIKSSQKTPHKKIIVVTTMELRVNMKIIEN
ncbi:hypothetical protein RND71_023172 [Anisodus tanguticus]|uniref:TCP domain-containing protein n=1 Tax=Anisodus tanguticus TaxID=243964 RepID=A0AAE1V6Q3_9SOLA|nr:hypothetical protein RND71_023172 [Anisodus tanguticus]